MTPHAWETTVQHNSLVPRPPPSEDEHRGDPGNETSQCDARASTGWLVTTVSSLTSQPTSTRNGKWSEVINVLTDIYIAGYTPNRLQSHNPILGVCF